MHPADDYGAQCIRRQPRTGSFSSVKNRNPLELHSARLSSKVAVKALKSESKPIQYKSNRGRVLGPCQGMKSRIYSYVYKAAATALTTMPSHLHPRPCRKERSRSILLFTLRLLILAVLFGCCLVFLAKKLPSAVRITACHGANDGTAKVLSSQHGDRCRAPNNDGFG